MHSGGWKALNDQDIDYEFTRCGLNDKNMKWDISDLYKSQFTNWNALLVFKMSLSIRNALAEGTDQATKSDRYKDETCLVILFCGVPFNIKMNAIFFFLRFVLDTLPEWT